MSRVVNGSATIKPINPKSTPHTDSESNRIAGLSPMALPMTLGVTIMSQMSCTMMNTAMADSRTSQKFCPVSAAFSSANNAAGMRAKVWR